MCVFLCNLINDDGDDNNSSSSSKNNIIFDKCVCVTHLIITLKIVIQMQFCILDTHTHGLPCNSMLCNRLYLYGLVVCWFFVCTFHSLGYTKNRTTLVKMKSPKIYS